MLQNMSNVSHTYTTNWGNEALGREAQGKQVLGTKDKVELGLNNQEKEVQGVEGH